MSNAAIVTSVLGELPANKLGITLAHEHFFLDLSCLWHEPQDAGRSHLIDAPVSALIRSELINDPYHCKDNLLLDDLDAAVEELSFFKKLGGASAIDLSSRSIGPYPELLVELSKQSGVNIIAGTGYYMKCAHPQNLASMSESEIADQMISELREGFAGTNVRAGVIGELGTSSKVHEDEVKVLKAAAYAQKETGAGINVHLSIFSQQGHFVLDVLESCGADLQRVALSHLDEFPDRKHHLSLAKRGCFLEFDCFGSEVYFDEDGLREPSDSERIEALLSLIESGYIKQILVSQDVCTKMQWRRHGGMGYDHILRSIFPRLLKRGLDEFDLMTIMSANPGRFLAGDS